ncbi:hypothetical protein Syun_011455 [Stephania yunnanensis]|uniref:ABC transporter domain-containing protein n=1 Tax=Stephania yunnanensis TaxID=152371 RepID=A0AAP0JYL5_9MAGN
MEGISSSLSRSISRNLASSLGIEQDGFGLMSPASSRRSRHAEEDEAILTWAAIEKLPTYDRLRTSIMKSVAEVGGGGEKFVHKKVDVLRLTVDDRTAFIDGVFKVADEDNEKFLEKLRHRIDRVGIQLPAVEVRFENLTIEADCFVGTRALPTLLNTVRNFGESVLGLLGIRPTKRAKVTILKNVSGIIKPSRMTLLLGPPSSGKTTLLLALAAKLDPDLKVKGEVTYNGHRFNEFVPQKTSAYVSQNDVHLAVMTVQETLDFSARCQGVGSRNELVTELIRREKEAGIFPEAEVDLFMKATAIEGATSGLKIDYTLKILGLDICKDTIVGDTMLRGISGGQKKRVTTGEMIVGPTKTLFMDEISTGLDSSTTYQIVKCLQHITHYMDATIVVSLLQPAPETFDLFDDVILLSEGQIVYQGPMEHVLEFFKSCGFQCPERKGTADFLQEVTSRKDQEQYWAERSEPYRYVSPNEFAVQFKKFHVGANLDIDLLTPYDKSRSHKAALVFNKHSTRTVDLLKANFAKEWLIIKRNSFLYMFRTVQYISVAFIGATLFFRTNMHTRNELDAHVYIGAISYIMLTNMFASSPEVGLTIIRLPVFYKHRDLLFHPVWTFTLPNTLLKIPISMIDSVVFVAITYYSIGLAPEPSRFFKHLLLIFLLQQAGNGLFRFLAGVFRDMTLGITVGSLFNQVLYMLGGFTIPRDEIPKWLRWGSWISPISYAYNALTVNELFAPRWMNKLASDKATRLGEAVLKNIGVFRKSYWYWIGAAALAGFAIVFNVLFTLALMYLNPFGKRQAIISEEAAQEMETKKEMKNKSWSVPKPETEVIRSLSASDANNTREMELIRMSSRASSSGLARNDDMVLEQAIRIAPKRGMVLPFMPLAMSFDSINYYVDMPPEMKAQGIEDDRLQLLRDVTGVFRPGVLTALMGVSGAGKTTLMDVLAGRKTGGYIEGDIRISGYPKNQETFARISGYCEQNDIHSPQLTVKESLIYSAFLRLPKEISNEDKMIFINEVMELVELDNLKGAIVGLPGITGLSTEQRKRLTIAVELVANPSIIFMDEPTSGLDARAAAIVMRTVRSAVDTGRTIVCTIHQPSIDIFETFDELLLMKRGGQLIYKGSLGHNSHKLIEYLEAIPGVPKIKEKMNPAAWMLEATSRTVETQLGIDFAELYSFSSLCRRNKDFIKELSIPAPGSKDLYFPTQYSVSTWVQFKFCLWKQWLIYWRNPDYNVVRFSFTLVAGLLLGSIYWKIGTKRETANDLLVVIGAMNAAVLFVGVNNSSTVQPVVDIGRTVFYRERAAGMYSAFPYAFSQVLTEVPYIFVQSSYYSLLIFSMMGFQWTATKFFWFFFICFFNLCYFTYFGMMAVAVTPNYRLSSIFTSAFFSVFNLFSGFFIPRPRIPKWWVWYYWICPVAWTVYGVIVSQYGDLENIIQVPGAEEQSIKDYVTNHYGYRTDYMGVVSGVLVGFTVFFACMFAFGISVFNFQRR